VLCEPVLTKLDERQRREQRFPGEETRWAVCEEVDGKPGHRWSLWVRQSAAVGLYRMAPGRGAEVPTAHGAQRPQAWVDVVGVGDRSRAYQGLAQACDERLLALCWAPVRRDGLKAARRGPERDRGRWAWSAARRELSRLHAARLAVWDATWRLAPHPAALVARHRPLETPRSPRPARCEAHLHEPDRQLVTPTVLRRLPTPWDGLPVCVGRPDVALDQNRAARLLRTPGVGRKHSDGSGSVWCAPLAARRCRVRPTVWLWGLTPPQWLSAC
jgi:transposase